jgi:hypothetical protein
VPIMLRRAALSQGWSRISLLRELFILDPIFTALRNVYDAPPQDTPRGNGYRVRGTWIGTSPGTFGGAMLHTVSRACSGP